MAVSGRAAYMLREDADFITSGAILHLTVKNSKALPEYLTLAFNSEALRMQVERDAGGSIILDFAVTAFINLADILTPDCTSTRAAFLCAHPVSAHTSILRTL
ncbi:MAG: hypothetical protein LBJ63_07165 [Prevotellaceae bacterium]|jgi:hypothetical protein|nr:hypothetical protein [Prevotellaceae bacterium]